VTGARAAPGRGGRVGAPAQVQSALAPDSLTIRVHLTSSAAVKSLNSFTDMTVISMPMAAKRCRVSASLSMAVVTDEIRFTTSAGRPAGPLTPHHGRMSKPGTVSAIGGTSGLLEGNPNQLLTQLYGVVVTALWCGGVTFVLLKLVSVFVPLRVSMQQEMEGLDISQHGEALQ